MGYIIKNITTGKVVASNLACCEQYLMESLEDSENLRVEESDEQIEHPTCQIVGVCREGGKSSDLLISAVCCMDGKEWDEFDSYVNYHEDPYYYMKQTLDYQLYNRKSLMS